MTKCSRNLSFFTHCPVVSFWFSFHLLQGEACLMMVYGHSSLSLEVILYCYIPLAVLGILFSFNKKIRKGHYESDIYEFFITITYYRLINVYSSIRKNFSKCTPASRGTCSFEVASIAAAKNVSASVIDSIKSCPRIMPPIMMDAKRSPVPE